MALTKSFRVAVQARVRSNQEYRRGLLSDAIESLLAGKTVSGRETLRDFINATLGVSCTGGEDRHPCKEIASDLRTQGKSHRRQSLQCHRLPARARRGEVAGGLVNVD